MKERLIDAGRLKYELEYIRPHLEEETRSVQKCIDLFAQTVDEQATIDPEYLPIVKALREKLEQKEQELRNVKYCYDIAKNGERQLRRQVNEITAEWAECAKKLKLVTAERDAAVKDLETVMGMNPNDDVAFITFLCEICENKSTCGNTYEAGCHPKWRGPVAENATTESEVQTNDRP